MKGLREEAERRTNSEMQLVSKEIENITYSVEKSVQSMSWIIGRDLSRPDSLFIYIKRLMDFTPAVANSAVAFVEDYYPSKGHWYEPLIARRDNGTLESIVLGSESHDYLKSSWFTEPVRTGKGCWSEPYFDESGAKTTVVTYAYPVWDQNGNIVGVCAADLSLGWLDGLLRNINLYPNSFSKLVSGSGMLLACPVDTSLVDKPILFSTPVRNIGWNLSIGIPEESVYKDIRRTGFWVILLQLLGLLLIIFILRSIVNAQMKFKKLNDKKERMESELRVAHGIQMAMLPNIFPPFPERGDIDMYAFLDPAKEVGGDLYDFYIRDNKLFFCIGDVSGKGVPAALVMAVTRSQFRTVSAHERSPLHIVTAMNNSMADINRDMMFVTFFCGILDLLNGHLRYCNAGHNGPLLIGKDGIKQLPVIPNLPLGIMPGMAYQEQETDLVYGEAIFLYTDGVTEAEDKDHRLFGEERLKETLAKAKGSAMDKLSKLKADISSFVGKARQSDDMTTMLLTYMNDKNPDSFERHLILHNDIRQIPQLAGFIETIAQDAHIDKSLAMSLNLALEEAVTNVIMYAYPQGSDGLVDIEAVIRKDSIDFMVIDSGKPFDPTAVPDANVDSALEDRPIGGLGIFLVRNIMDSVKYERKEGKNLLSMTKRI
jgi:serine phosphatase RsbU (regulator of sigma subunit)/anti-sigma regulatory factor (Ser/Thr protein kinase)